MKLPAESAGMMLLLQIGFALSNPGMIIAQETLDHAMSYQEYADEVMDTDDEYLSSMEEWRDMIDQWLEKPLCINSEEADWLMEYKIISLFQLNKLKEYRMIYGDLLSVYEMGFIEGWDFQTIRKVIPLVTTEVLKNTRTFKRFTIRSFRQSLILKTAFATQKSKGYKEGQADVENSGPVYTGPPFRLSLRYDLEYRNKLAVGLRMEKDPGEPVLIPSDSWIGNIKTPDLFSGYLHLKQIGPFRSIIAGDYRLSFGYGLNIAGGLSGIRGKNGLSGMADRIRPQTSLSEAGFFRGVAFTAGLGRISFSGFGSWQAVDGTSVVFDSLSGKPLSFSSIDGSGMHRTLSEISKKQSVTEKLAGGWLVFRNNWMKTGITAVYNRFDAAVAGSSRPYAKFYLTGKKNFVAGISTTIWMPKFSFFGEASISMNKGTAVLAGIQFIPVAGTLFMMTFRHFDIDYQNLHGSGFISSGRNSNESGLLFGARIEFPDKWIFEFFADVSQSTWTNYTLDSPSRQYEVKLQAEKCWMKSRSLILSFIYDNETINNPESSARICHPVTISGYRLRLEGRIEAEAGIVLKSRVEYNYTGRTDPGMVIFQDVEFTTGWIDTRLWLRACFFDAQDYENRIYAYEHDVIYDFTSFMHYGKGIRGIVMARTSPARWLDIWLRLSTVYYTNKYIGSGWDETGSNRQNEIEIQVRIKSPV
jgi:hypothetical protein